VASLSDQINDRPVLFALLKVIQSQRYGFVPPQPAGEQQCQQCAVAFSFQSLMVGCLPKNMTLLRCEPVPETHAQLLDAFHPANASGGIGTEQTAVGSFVCESAYRAKAQIDGARCELTGFEMRSIAQHHHPVERQARFRTVPVNEFIDGLTITSPGVRTGETVQDCGFCML
jgi:hypothetical protein